MADQNNLVEEIEDSNPKDTAARVLLDVDKLNLKEELEHLDSFRDRADVRYDALYEQTVSRMEQEEEAKRQERAKRVARMRLEKEKQLAARKRMKKLMLIGIPVVILVVAVILVAILLRNKKSDSKSFLANIQEKVQENVAGNHQEDIAGNTGAKNQENAGGSSGIQNAKDQLQGQSDGSGSVLIEKIPQDDAANAGASGQQEDANSEQTETEDDGAETLAFLGENATDDGQNIQVGEQSLKSGYSFTLPSTAVEVTEEGIASKHILLINAQTGEVVAQRASTERIYPASMTKILTVLVAAEQMKEEELEEKVAITFDMANYAYVHDCSAVNFDQDESVTVRDLFYGTILPSGADAALGLACYVAGSQDDFVKLMNDKLKELGISDTTHFTNCIGIYNDNHYSTLYDMAVIMKAAVENDFCRQVLSEHVYTTGSTTEHPEGITISNWFLRRIEDKDSGGLVLCAKTGFVNQSGNCAASYEISSSGVPYICVTADAYSSWRCIYDHVAVYSTYGK